MLINLFLVSQSITATYVFAILNIASKTVDEPRIVKGNPELVMLSYSGSIYPNFQLVFLSIPYFSSNPSAVDLPSNTSRIEKPSSVSVLKSLKNNLAILLLH